MTDDIYVYIIPFPTLKATEMVVPCDGGYTVYLNAKMSKNRLLEAYNHALTHIKNHDWEKDDVNQIEFLAREKTAI